VARRFAGGSEAAEPGAVPVGILGKSADLIQEVAHGAFDTLAGLIDQADLPAGAEEAFVNLGQSLFGEPLAAGLHRADDPGQLRIAARAMTEPYQVVVGRRRYAESAHVGARRLGSSAYLVNRLPLRHVQPLSPGSICR
jgi:hypothetical protein